MFPANGLGACVRDSSIEVHPGVGQSRALSAFWSFECIMAAEFLSWLSRGCACPFLHLPCGSSLPAPVCCLFAVLAPQLLGCCLYDGFVRALCSGSDVFSPDGVMGFLLCMHCESRPSVIHYSSWWGFYSTHITTPFSPRGLCSVCLIKRSSSLLWATNVCPVYF